MCRYSFDSHTNTRANFFNKFFSLTVLVFSYLFICYLTIFSLEAKREHWLLPLFLLPKGWSFSREERCERLRKRCTTSKTFPAFPAWYRGTPRCRTGISAISAKVCLEEGFVVGFFDACRGFSLFSKILRRIFPQEVCSFKFPILRCFLLALLLQRKNLRIETFPDFLNAVVYFSSSSLSID